MYLCDSLIKAQNCVVLNLKSMSNDKRFEKILQRIEAQKRAKENNAQYVTLSAVLDSLNALDTLDNVHLTDRKGWICWGPRAFKGSGWMAALVWCKPTTYHGYRLLTMVGIWAVSREGGIDIIFGTKTLTYSAPFYEAEVYHKLMRDTFETYYTDKGSPPDEAGRLFVVPYAADKRLEIRAALKSEIERWATQPPP
jgi:hypothetical protein